MTATIASAPCRFSPPRKAHAVIAMPTAMPAVPLSSSGRRPARSSSQIATMVIPTLTAPLTTLASSAAELPNPAPCSSVGA